MIITQSQGLSDCPFKNLFARIAEWAAELHYIFMQTQSDSANDPAGPLLQIWDILGLRLTWRASFRLHCRSRRRSKTFGKLNRWDVHSSRSLRFSSLTYMCSWHYVIMAMSLLLVNLDQATSLSWQCIAVNMLPFWIRNKHAVRSMAICNLLYYIDVKLMLNYDYYIHCQHRPCTGNAQLKIIFFQASCAW